MVEIISVRLRNSSRTYSFNPAGEQFARDDGVIVETSRGMEYGTCAEPNTMVDEIELTAPLRPVIRKATDEDRQTLIDNKEKEAVALKTCRAKIKEHRLDMKLVSAEYSFDGSKVLFLFTSEGRVDFRSLVKDLAGALHARIELRQIGVRDEAKMLGGLGICGRPFCCTQYMDDFQPVSIKMAKNQNLSLNPAKISGTCGRLMCCLKYEEDAYEDLMKSAPRMESFVETPDGAGTVTGINLLRQTAQVRLDSAPETPKTYLNSELAIVRSGKGRRPEGYVEPPPEELEKLRAVREKPDPEPPAELVPQLPGIQDEDPAPEGGQHRRRRNRGKGSGGQEEQGQKQEKPKQQQQTSQPKSAKQPQQQKQQKASSQNQGKGARQNQEKKSEKSQDRKAEKPPEKKGEKSQDKKAEKPPEKKGEKPQDRKPEKSQEKKSDRSQEKASKPAEGEGESPAGKDSGQGKKPRRHHRPRSGKSSGGEGAAAQAQTPAPPAGQ